MASLSRLGKQIEEVVAALDAIAAPFALIGGLALASHKVVRATQDVDLLTDVDSAAAVDRAVVALGFDILHRNLEVANYARGDERLDFLFASRPIARRLLANARSLETEFGPLRVISAEGLIGFKLQALVNDPRRTRDLEDIRALLRANRGNLDLVEIREFFRLFQREALLEELLNEAD
jgi:hypothetical protein